MWRASLLPRCRVFERIRLHGQVSLLTSSTSRVLKVGGWDFQKHLSGVWLTWLFLETSAVLIDGSSPNVSILSLLLDLKIRKKRSFGSRKMNRNPARLHLSPCWGAESFHGPAVGWRGSSPASPSACCSQACFSLNAQKTNLLKR